MLTSRGCTRFIGYRLCEVEWLIIDIYLRFGDLFVKGFLSVFMRKINVLRQKKLINKIKKRFKVHKIKKGISTHKIWKNINSHRI